jgi:hypothetical protein
MAKNVGRLAGLAALGAAAYMMSKGKGKEAETTDSKPARPKSTETGRMSDEDKAEMKRETQRGPIAQFPSKVESTPVSKRSVKSEDLPSAETLKSVSEPSDKSIKLAPENRDLETTMTRGQQTPAAAASTVSSSEEGMKNYKPRRTPKASTTSSSEVGMKNYKPRRTPPVVSQIPGQSRSGPTGGERVSGTELSRNLSNAAAALTPLTGGTSKVATEFAMGRNATKAATAEKLSPAGQRLKDTKDFVRGGYPGRDAAVTNPMAWAGGPKTMEKIAQAEGRAAAAETRAAAAEARAAAAQAKRDAKDPFMNFKPGSDFKRGGAVKMTASSRADGIASRGKTKCKMY